MVKEVEEDEEEKEVGGEGCEGAADGEEGGHIAGAEETPQRPERLGTPVRLSRVAAPAHPTIRPNGPPRLPLLMSQLVRAWLASAHLECPLA